MGGMFTYKYCQKCQKRNHKKREHCVRCGDQLLNDPKFGISVFVVTLSIVMLLSAASVYASKSYFSPKSADSQSNTQVQNVEPKKEDIKPEITQEPTKEEVASEPVTETPVKKEKVVTPQVTAPPIATPICDEGQKQIYVQMFTVNFNDAKTEMKRLTDEVFARKDYDTQEAELNQITNDFVDKTNLYYSQYLQNMKSINCPAEQLLQLKD